MNDIVLTPEYWASVSGGKDSLMMMKVIFDNPHLYKLDGVIHFELENDYPFVSDVTNIIKNECLRRGVKFVSIKPRKSWDELYNKYGYPTSNARWCNGKYKMDAMKQLKEYLKSNNKYPITYIGYCYDEVKRYVNRKNKNEIYPLVDFKIYEYDVLRWARKQDCFNDFYKIVNRQGCMMCPLSSYIELAYCYVKYRKVYNHYMMKAMITEETLNISIFQSNKKYNCKYVNDVVKNKYSKIVIDIINKC